MTTSVTWDEKSRKTVWTRLPRRYYYQSVTFKWPKNILVSMYFGHL